MNVLCAQATTLYTPKGDPNIEDCQSKPCELGIVVADALLKTCEDFSGSTCHFALLRQEDIPVEADSTITDTVMTSTWTAATLKTIERTGAEIYSLLLKGLVTLEDENFLSLSSNLRVVIDNIGNVEFVQYRDKYGGCSDFVDIQNNGDVTYTVAIMDSTNSMLSADYGLDGVSGTSVTDFGADWGGNAYTLVDKMTLVFGDLGPWWEWQYAELSLDACGTESSQVDITPDVSDDDLEFVLSQCTILFSDADGDATTTFDNYCWSNNS